jgi:pimeloyl-ACP methyl ester carboxylesterase
MYLKHAMPLMKIFHIVILALIGLLVLGVTFEQWSRWRAPRIYPPFGEMVDIGGRELHLDCAGSGLPVVIFEAGGGSSSVVWQAVQTRVAERTTACSYDRAGIAWSDGAAGPRGADQLIGDLRTLVRGASLAQPYVLVGHSLGGPIVAGYAGRYPEEVAGLVLVDPTASELSLGQIENWGVVERLQMLAMRAAHETGLTRLSLSRSARLSEHAKLFGPRDQATMLEEIRDSYSLFAEAAQIQSFGALPLIILSGGRSPVRVDRVSAEEIQGFHQGLLAEHAELATRSTRGQHRVLDSGHFIQIEAAAEVAEAVLQVVATARGAV